MYEELTPAERFVGISTGILFIVVGIVMFIAPFLLCNGHTISTACTVVLAFMFGVHNMVVCYKPLCNL